MTKLLRDKHLLAHFPCFLAGMYKQSFSGAALIYQQNPYATNVATLEMWDKLVMSRKVRIFIWGQDKRIGRKYTAAEISELLASGRVTLKNGVSSKGTDTARSLNWTIRESTSI